MNPAHLPSPGPGSGLGVQRIQPAYQQVADQLREQILTGNLVPGDRLPVEADLAGVFGVSRSTIREALRLLGSQGLIHTQRGVTGGTFVSETDHESISEFIETRLGLLTGASAITSTELLEARQLLEVPAARLAAERRTDAHLALMQTAIELERGESERSGRFAQHQQFHQVMLDAADNRLIQLMTVPIFRVIRTRFLSDDPTASFWHDVDDDHVDILEHIRERDADAAAKAMEDHLGRLRAVYRKAEGRG